MKKLYYKVIYTLFLIQDIIFYTKFRNKYLQNLKKKTGGTLPMIVGVPQSSFKLEGIVKLAIVKSESRFREFLEKKECKKMAKLYSKQLKEKINQNLLERKKI